MARFFKSLKDPEGTQVRVECGFRGADGRHYLLLRRLPPEYAKPPLWLVELSSDRLTQRDPVSGEQKAFPKAYSIQELSESEKQFLLSAAPGKAVSPFFNFSYPNVIRVLGKKFHKLEDADTAKLVDSTIWALLAGRT